MDSKMLQGILAEHRDWYLGNNGGRRADLSGADLSGADLSDADLSRANLSGADLSGANLGRADLSRAYLGGANLSRAYLSGANLSRAYLSDADLRDADLRRANLRGADLSGADLRRACKLPHFQIPEGRLIVYKKVQGKIVKLGIPVKAKRTASLVGRKCRAEYAKVLDIEGGGDVETRGVVYAIGGTVVPDSYDDDIRIECTHGIHFFLTLKEAEEWN